MLLSDGYNRGATFGFLGAEGLRRKGKGRERGMSALRDGDVLLLGRYIRRATKC